MRVLLILAIVIAMSTAVETYESKDGLITVKLMDYDTKTVELVDGKTVDVYKYSKNVKVKVDSPLKDMHIEIYNLESKDLAYFNFTKPPALINITLPEGKYELVVNACGTTCYICGETCSEFNSYGKFIIEVTKASEYNETSINKTCEKINQSKLVVESVFANNSKIPKKYAYILCGGYNINPPLYLKNLSKNAKSLVIVVEDPDAGNFLHWLAWNVEPTDVVPEGIPKSRIVQNPKMIQGVNDFGGIGYGGPCPPIGERHHYYFRVYALDTFLNLPITATKDEVMNAMQGHVIQEGLLVGVYP